MFVYFSLFKAEKNAQTFVDKVLKEILKFLYLKRSEDVTARQGRD